MAEYFTLDKITSYSRALLLSNYIWEVVIKWDWFAKKTLGSQWVESTDSISANIAEGFGRNSKKDKIRFFFYSKGSLLESKDWFSKAKTRSLLTAEQIQFIGNELDELPRELNYLIKNTNEKLKY